MRRGLGGGGGVTAAQVVLADSYGNRPSPGTQGRLFICYDSPLVFWDAVGLWLAFYHGRKVTLPPTSYTTTNIGVATHTSPDGRLFLTETSAAGGDHCRLLNLSGIAKNTNFVITARIKVYFSDSNASHAGIAIRDSNSDRAICFVVTQNTGNRGVSIYDWGVNLNTGPGAVESIDNIAPPTGRSALANGREICLQIANVTGSSIISYRILEDDGTTREICQQATDGLYDSFNPDNACLCLFTNIQTVPSSIELFDWTVTS